MFGIMSISVGPIKKGIRQSIAESYRILLKPVLNPIFLDLTGEYQINRRIVPNAKFLTHNNICWKHIRDKDSANLRIGKQKTGFGVALHCPPTHPPTA